MERAQAQVIGSSFFKLDKRANYFHNIDAALYLLYAFLRYQFLNIEAVIYICLGD